MKKILILVCSFGLLSSYSPVYSVEMVNNGPLWFMTAQLIGLTANLAESNSPMRANIMAAGFLAIMFGHDYWKSTQSDSAQPISQQTAIQSVTPGVRRMDVVQYEKPKMNHKLNILFATGGLLCGAALGYLTSVAVQQKLISRPQVTTK